MMKNMMKSDTFVSVTGRQIARLYADESGATAIEYAMVASGVGVAVAATVYSLGSSVKNLFVATSNLFGS